MNLSAVANKGRSFFQTRQKILSLAVTAYLLMLIVSHWQIPSIHVWLIAAVFSVLMNFTYLVEAVSLKSYAATESWVAFGLIALSILGFFTSPLFLIVAIVGHGVWDLAKHFGAGVPFLSWYSWSCFLVDMAYGSALLFYFVYRA